MSDEQGLKGWLDENYIVGFGLSEPIIEKEDRKVSIVVRLYGGRKSIDVVVEEKNDETSN
ncbi:MAG: hypothetical protein GOVbin631_36 [Prokaryotic dsDNA virus sp.]|nr:MAG: hypothetical protein GOVbin631_36 [Prokaryotic dsDNA virus sp.]